MVANTVKRCPWEYACLIGAAILWGIAFPLSKYAMSVGKVDSLHFFALRALLAAPLFIPMLFQKRSEIVWWQLALLGALGVALYFGLLGAALQLRSVANVTLILMTTPAITAVLSRVIFRTSVSKKQWMGIAVAFLGVLVVEVLAAFGWPTVLLISCALLWSVYTIALIKVKGESLVKSGGTVVFGAMFLVPTLFLAPSEGKADLFNYSLIAWTAIIVSALCASGLAYLLWAFGVAIAGPTKAAVFLYLVPLAAIPFSIPILHEVPTIWTLAGGSLIMVGVVLATKKPNPQGTRSWPSDDRLDKCPNGINRPMQADHLHSGPASTVNDASVPSSNQH